MSKASKATARYQGQPHGEERCATCSMFRGPDNCTAVEGVISPRGWCSYWDSAMTDTAAAIKDAVKATDRDPTDAQKEAGNYAKGKFPWRGLTVAVETPKGALRSGVDKSGKKWSVRQPATYGYVLGSLGKDGDHVDVYVGDAHESRKVWVIDQIDAETGKFDEHKAFLNFPSKDVAVMTYGRAFSDGKAKDRMGAVTEMPVEKFVHWVRFGDTKKPLGLRQRFADGGRVAVPLIKSGAKQAVSHNIKAEMAAGKPHKQAIAIAMDTARRYAKRAFGGRTGYDSGGRVGAIAQQAAGLASLADPLLQGPRESANVDDRRPSPDWPTDIDELLAMYNAPGTPKTQRQAMLYEMARRGLIDLNTKPVGVLPGQDYARGGRAGYAEGGWAGEMDSPPDALAERPRSPVPEYLAKSWEMAREGRPDDKSKFPDFMAPVEEAVRLTGIPAALRAGSAYNRGDIGEAAIEGATAVAPAIFPAARALGSIPKAVTIPAIGGLVASALGSDSSKTEETPVAKRNAEIRALQEMIAVNQAKVLAAQKDIGATKFRGVGEEAGLARQKAMELAAAPYTTAITRAEERIKELRAANDEEQNALVRAERDANAVRLETLKEGNQPFNKTPVGEQWNKLGPAAPFVIGAGTALAERLFRGPKAGIKEPLLWGTGAGAASANIPVGWDAFFTPTVNPEATAFRKYGQELKIANHPRAQEWLDYADKLPQMNPGKADAKKEFWDPDNYGLGLAKRMAFGAGEGLLGAGLGTATAIGLERPFKYFFGSRQKQPTLDLTPEPSTGGPGLPGGPGTPTPGGLPGGTPQSKLLPSPSQATPLEARAPDPTPPRFAARLGDYRKSVPEPKPEAGPSSPKPASASPQTPDWAGEPPAGVTLKKNQLWDKNVQQVREIKPGQGARFAKTRFSAKSLTERKAPSKKNKGSEPETGDFQSGGAVRAALDAAKNYARFARGGVVVGAVKGATGGRADELPVNVPSGSFVIPADCVSGMPNAGGNTEAGMRELEKMFGKPQTKRAAGGAVPIMISHGEFVLSPEQVANVGGGDMERGHRTLDAFVRQVRAHNVKTLKGLPGPAK